MNETDWFYYIALAIATFVVIYIIYISLQFQNNMMEGFSMGGGGADKGKSKGKGEGNVVGQSVDVMYEENTKIEEGIKLSDNKDEYKNMLELIKSNLRLNALQSIAKTAGDKNLKPEVKAQSMSIVSAALKLSIDGLSELEENI
jgi:hypothetical protein